MRKGPAILFCLLLHLIVHGQGHVADSLRKLITKARSDSTKISLLNELSRHYYFDLGQRDSAEWMAKQCAEIAGKKKCFDGEIEAFLNLSRQYGNSGKKQQSIHASRKALSLARQQNLKAREADVLKEISFGYSKLGFADTAAAYMDSAFVFVNKNSLEDKKAELYITLAREIWGLNQDSALQLSYIAISLARAARQPLAEARALENLAYLLRGQRIDTAMLLYRQILGIYTRHHFDKFRVKILTVLVSMRVVVKPAALWRSYFEEGLHLAGSLNSKMDSLALLEQYAYASISIGDYPAALPKYLQVLEVYKDLRLENNVAVTMSHIGNLYSEQGDYQQSLSYLFDAQELCKKNNRLESLIWVYNLMAANYIRMKQDDSARIYTRKGYNLAYKFYNGSIPGFVLNDIGDNFFEIGEYEQALVFFRTSYPELLREGEPNNICIATYGFAKVFNMTGQEDSCIYWAKTTLNIASSSGLLGFIVKAANLLTGYFKTKGNIDSAFYYQQVTVAAKDSLYNQEKQRQISDIGFAKLLQQKETEQQVEKTKLEYKSRIKMYFLGGGIGVLLLVAVLLFHNNRQKQKSKTKIEAAYKELKSTQAQLIQSEKMASLGELTAGIAHEIQNPLNFVNNFSEVSNELLDEMNEEIKKGNIDNLQTRAGDIKQNLEKILHHGQRADAIVKGMLQHSQRNTGVKEPTDINKMADEYLRLSYHGLRAKNKEFNATLQTDFDAGLGKTDIISQDIGRVLLNLYNNAFFAVSEKAKQDIPGYNPTVTVSTKKSVDRTEISVKDNGNGIPQNIINKIFQPFFTTKPTGQGTGLGLSLAYDIVKAHGGELKVETREGEGSEFIVSLST